MKGKNAILLLAAGLLLSASASITDDVIAVRDGRNAAVRPGVWHADLNKARAYAEANGLPLVAVWSNGDECAHCVAFENCIMSPAFRNWMNDGGETTVRQFCACSEDEREMILEYLEEFSLIEETEAGGREYVIVHAGLEPFDPDKDLQDYDLIACIFWSPDPDQRYYEDRIVISGHTPTLAFPEPLKGKVIEKNGHVLIDCGCVFGGSLAVYCLDNGQVTYIPAKKGRR